MNQHKSKREESTNAAMMDALTKQLKINSVGFMGLGVILRNVVMKVVPIIQGLEGFVLNMVQKLRVAVMKDVPTKLSATMFVCGMEESKRRSTSRLADMRAVPIVQGAEEEFVLNTVQKLRSRLASMKDVPTKPEGRKGYVSGMGASE